LAFPLWEKAQEEETAENSETEGELIDLNGKRLLLVEDNDINAEIASLVLAEYGIILERAVNGREGAAMVREKGDGYYDAVLMDIQMPVMNGYEATKEIRQTGTQYTDRLPIIAMSANAYEEDIRASLESGMNGHIAKPFEPEKLMAKLQRMIIRTRDTGK
jgi:CheY-like chemotaxis protein